MTIIVPLSKHGKHAGKYETKIDDCDSDLAESDWVIAGRYVVGGNHERLHSVILERKLGRPLQKGEVVDHANGDTLDNCRDNLRLATRSQNNANKKMSKSNTSGYKGVSWDKKKGKWLASITKDRKQYNLGYFDTPQEAHETYKTKAIELFGEFANFGGGQ